MTLGLLGGRSVAQEWGYYLLSYNDWLVANYAKTTIAPFGIVNLLLYGYRYRYLVSTIYLDNNDYECISGVNIFYILA